MAEPSTFLLPQRHKGFRQPLNNPELLTERSNTTSEILLTIKLTLFKFLLEKTSSLLLSYC